MKDRVILLSLTATMVIITLTALVPMTANGICIAVTPAFLKIPLEKKKICEIKKDIIIKLRVNKFKNTFFIFNISMQLFTRDNKQFRHLITLNLTSTHYADTQS